MYCDIRIICNIENKTKWLTGCVLNTNIFFCSILFAGLISLNCSEEMMMEKERERQSVWDQWEDK